MRERACVQVRVCACVRARTHVSVNVCAELRRAHEHPSSHTHTPVKLQVVSSRRASARRPPTQIAPVEQRVSACYAHNTCGGTCDMIRTCGSHPENKSLFIHLIDSHTVGFLAIREARDELFVHYHPPDGHASVQDALEARRSKALCVAFSYAVFAARQLGSRLQVQQRAILGEEGHELLHVSFVVDFQLALNHRERFTGGRVAACHGSWRFVCS